MKTHNPIHHFKILISRSSELVKIPSALRWRHNDHAGVSNHQPHGCLLNRLFRRKSKKTSKLRVTGLCAGNSPGTGEFPAQMASYAENVSIWWRHHGLGETSCHFIKRSHENENQYWPWNDKNISLPPTLPCLNVITCRILLWIILQHII